MLESRKLLLRFARVRGTLRVEGQAVRIDRRSLVGIVVLVFGVRVFPVGADVGSQPGACCQPDGTCVMATEPGGADCTAAHGEYQGDDTDCATVQCPPVGACCLPTADFEPCRITIESACVDHYGGVYMGDASDCTSCLGACCYDFLGCLITTHAYTCDQKTKFGFQGYGSTCDTCPTYGCCLPDGSCFVTQAPGTCIVDMGGTLIADDCHRCLAPCPADLGGNGIVDFDDVQILLSNWSTDGAGSDLAPPLALVDFDDLLVLLSQYGPCL